MLRTTFILSSNCDIMPVSRFLLGNHTSFAFAFYIVYWCLLYCFSHRLSHRFSYCLSHLLPPIWTSPSPWSHLADLPPPTELACHLSRGWRSGLKSVYSFKIWKSTEYHVKNGQITVGFFSKKLKMEPVRHYVDLAIRMCKECKVVGPGVV